MRLPPTAEEFPLRMRGRYSGIARMMNPLARFMEGAPVHESSERLQHA
jgi:hypothetical protein